MILNKYSLKLIFYSLIIIKCIILYCVIAYTNNQNYTLKSVLEFCAGLFIIYNIDSYWTIDYIHLYLMADMFITISLVILLPQNYSVNIGMASILYGLLYLKEIPDDVELKYCHHEPAYVAINDVELSNSV
jgi:hypothetical protein